MPYAQPLSDAETQLVLPERFSHEGKRRQVLWGAALAVAAVAGVAMVLLLRAPVKTSEYRTARVERRTIVQSVEATGHLDVLQRVQVPAAIAGRIQDILVTPGTRVKTGDPLAKLDDGAAVVAVRGSRASLQAATSRVAEADAALTAARDTLVRVERLADKGLASPNELTTARASAAKGEAALKAARAERSVAAQSLAQAELGEDLGTLRAPTDGVVLTVKPVLGAAVSPETGPLFIIGSSLERMRLFVDVAEADIGHVRVGQPATFRVPAYLNRVFSAKVERVDIDGDRSGTAVTYPVTLRVDNGERLLLPAMTATVTIEVARVQDALSVREAALRFSPENASAAPARSRVWLKGSDRFVPIDVTPGISDGAYTEVRPKPESALREGDAVAVGIARAGGTDSNGPGISLGKRQ